MRKSCTECGEEFEAKRDTAKYCGERCKKRAQRRPSAPSAPAAPVVELPAESFAGSLTAATLADLERAGRVDTADGQAALALARRVDLGAKETGASLAALVREHRAALAEAVRDAETAADPLDELRARRERKLAGG
jgi:hypothetical protein